METSHEKLITAVESDAAKFYLAFILEFDSHWKNLEDSGNDTLDLAFDEMEVHRTENADEMYKFR